MYIGVSVYCIFAICPHPICLRHDQQSEMSVHSDDEKVFIVLCGRGCLFQFQSSKLKLKVSEGFPISRWIIPPIGHLLTKALPAPLIMVSQKLFHWNILSMLNLKIEQICWIMAETNILKGLLL